MRLALLSTLALPLLVAPDLEGVTVEADTTVTKTFTNVLSMEVVDLEVSIDGEDQDIPEDQQPKISISDEEEVVFEDKYVAVADGKPTEILRTFTTLIDNSSETVAVPGSDEFEKSEEGESELEGETVRFLWDAEAEEYEVSFAEDDDQDASLLEELEADADFLFLLSDEEMEVGASWEVDALAFDRISSPSGNLKSISPDSDEELDDAFSESFRDNLEGTFEGTYKSLEEGVATIVYEGEVTTAFEIESTGEGAPPQTFELTFTFTGTLLWNVEKGVASEFQFDGDVEMRVGVEITRGERELVQVQVFEGEFESTAEFE